MFYFDSRFHCRTHDQLILEFAGVEDLTSAKPFTKSKAIEKYFKSVGVAIKLDPNMKIPCSMHTWCFMRTSFALLPNQYAADAEISTNYGSGDASKILPSSHFKSFIDRNKI
ncbi:hypothetical protein Bca52824_018011 [Brassica carinata]|uniref:Uncharacterized protein n=1 Tax=Brassica carinata TaxID=52824 RepID=A0A8X8AVZ6_BRACI|nr:hypothetical protein Bca52824_018011 [Brassica carinata]